LVDISFKVNFSDKINRTVTVDVKQDSKTYPQILKIDIDELFENINRSCDSCKPPVLNIYKYCYREWKCGFCITIFLLLHVNISDASGKNTMLQFPAISGLNRGKGRDKAIFKKPDQQLETIGTAFFALLKYAFASLILFCLRKDSAMR
jgi:hypothetical protein